MNNISNSAPSILFFLEGSLVPASRFRVLQFQSKLDAQSIKYKNLFTRPSKYLYYPAFVRGNPLKLPWAAFCLFWVILQRLVQILIYARSYDVIVLQRDLLYRVNYPILERVLFFLIAARRRAGKVRLVFDVDDAIFLGRDGKHSAVLDHKLWYICSHCDLIITGNEYLRQYFSRWGRAIVIPTVIDCDRYLGRGVTEKAPLVIGWTGSSSNLQYLASIQAALEKLKQRIQFRLMIIAESGAKSPFKNSDLMPEFIAWNPDQEIEQLKQFDIGLMPLPDNDWARGKCGFKLLQYMAMGIPSVASAIGVNSEILASEQVGYLAVTEAEWCQKLELLLTRADLRRSIGAAAAAAVRHDYSLKRWQDSWCAALLENLPSTK